MAMVSKGIRACLEANWSFFKLPSIHFADISPEASPHFLVHLLSPPTPHTTLPDPLLKLVPLSLCCPLLRLCVYIFPVSAHSNKIILLSTFDTVIWEYYIHTPIRWVDARSKVEQMIA